MLEDIASIVDEYLYHCEIDNSINGYSIKSVWTANKLIGKRYYYVINGLTKTESYNIQKKFCVRRSETYDKKENSTEVHIFNKRGELVDSGIYINGISACRVIYHKFNCREEILYDSDGYVESVIHYKNNKIQHYTIWNCYGKSVTYSESCCLIL